MNDADGTGIGGGDHSAETRTRQTSGGKSKKLKDNRFAAPRRALVLIPCKHNTKSFACGKIRHYDIEGFKEGLFKFPDKVRQDCLISQLVHSVSLNRRSPSDKDLEVSTKTMLVITYQKSMRRRFHCPVSFLL